MTFSDQLRNLERFSTIETLDEATRIPIKYSPEEFVGVIPSIVLGSDGPTLSRLLLVSRRLLCEVRLGERPFSFDYVERGTIFNYRFELMTHVVQDGDEIGTCQ